MKLSMSMIANYLQHYHPECHISEDTLSIKGVRFFSDQALQYSLEYVYIGPAEGYFQDPRFANALILANGQNHILCHSADSEELLNDVLSAFDYYNGMEQNLYTAAVRHRPLEEMTRVIENILPGSFLVFSLDGILLSATRPDTLQDKEVLSPMLHKSSIRLTALGSTMIDMEGKISHDLTDKPLHLRRKDKADNGGISMYLYQEQEPVGFVMYFPISDLDIPLGLCLEPFFAGYLTESAEFSAPDSSLQSTHSIFIQLLKGAEVPSVLVQKLQTNFPEDASTRLIVFQTLAIQNYTIRNVIRNELESSSIPCISCEFEESGVLLTPEDHMEKIIRLLKNKLPADNIAIGISLPVLDLLELPAAYSQASFALRAKPGPGIRFCQDLALSHLILTLRNDTISCQLLHPAIAILQKYDRLHGTELFPTLRYYIRTGCNQVETARDMHIHLNTLKYRIRRICELTHTDFRAENELLYLQLSIQIQDGNPSL